MRKIWILDNWRILDNCYSEYEVFESLVDARKAAEAVIRKWNNITKEETDEILKDIDESYDEESGFYSKGNFYCWQIPYHAKEEN